MQKRDGFWLTSTGSNFNPGAKHLFCVLTDPCEKGEQLIANVTSRKAGKHFDPACLLDVGDHPDIDRPSYILYDQARAVWPKLLETWRTGHQITLTTQFAEGTFNRICEGLLVSDFTKPIHKTYFRTNRAR